MEKMQAQQKMFQSNNHKLQEVESKCNCLSSTFNKYASFNQNNFESIAKTHQNFLNKLSKQELH